MEDTEPSPEVIAGEEVAPDAVDAFPPADEAPAQPPAEEPATAAAGEGEPAASPAADATPEEGGPNPVDDPPTVDSDAAAAAAPADEPAAAAAEADASPTPSEGEPAAAAAATDSADSPAAEGDLAEAPAEIAAEAEAAEAPAPADGEVPAHADTPASDGDAPATAPDAAAAENAAPTAEEVPAASSSPTPPEDEPAPAAAERGATPPEVDPAPAFEGGETASAAECEPTPAAEGESTPAAAQSEPEGGEPASAAGGEGGPAAAAEVGQPAPAPEGEPAPAAAELGATPPEVEPAPAAEGGESAAAAESNTPAAEAATKGAEASAAAVEAAAGDLAATPETVSEPPKAKLDSTTEYHPASFRLLVDPDKEYEPAEVPLLHILSLDSYKRNNICYIEDDVLMTAAGNNVVFLRLPGMEQDYLPGLDGGSIGALAVHPTRKFFAVAEKCRHRSPNVYIYGYPDRKLVRVMRLGTERAYSALAFNDRGDMLASVGSYPDFLLTLWNWDEESIILRSKAFSQEVYTVRFSPYLEGILHTCGTGHIRFWKMADTFTGLKLQGQLGKFGTVELTDVAAFVELPDGKVLSGSERGELLMWDGGLIKVVLTRPNNKPCHNGNIQVLYHERNSNMIMTGGADGYIRLWDFVKVNEAEAEEDSHYLAIQPVDELLIASGARIKALLWERRRWIIFDEGGGIFIVHLSDQAGTLSKTATVARLSEFHAGGIVGMAGSPEAHITMTAGQDGSVRVWDFAERRLIHTTRFSGPATTAIPLNQKANVLLVGFKDGVVRAVQRCHDGMRLVAAFKPHKGGVTALSLSPDSRRLASAGEEGTVFIFDIKSTLAFEPVVCVPIVGGPVTCMTWNSDGRLLMCGTRGGAVLELEPPHLGTVDTHKTFMLDRIPTRQYNFKLPKPPKEKKKRRKKKKNPDGTDAEAEGGEGEAAADGEKAEGGSAEAGTEGGEGGGADGEDKEGEDGDKEGEEEELDMDDAFQEAETFEVCTITYTVDGSGSFLLTLGGKACSSVWSCSFDSPDVPLPVMPAFASAPTTLLRYHPTAPFLAMGSADGMVRLQPTDGPMGAPLKKLWQAPLHDMVDGRVSGVVLSFDGAYLLSAGYDGTLYLQEMKLGGNGPTPATPKLDNIKTLELAPPAATDILNPKEYTLEEAKQKAEQDLILAEAEAKKMGVRELLNHIRAEFEALLAENEAKAEAERLPRTEFEVDPGLREMIEEETRQREEVARLELAWETEKRRLALAKLKAHFLDNVEVERIVLHSLRSKQYITTFRTGKLTDEVVMEMAAAAEATGRNGSGRGQEGGGRKTGLDGEKRNGVGGTEGGATSAAEPGAANGYGAPGGTEQLQDTSKMTKADLRRQARKKRESDWATFNATKPDDKYENPADVTEIEEAERNMGDFKLKSDPNYVIPEEERMTPQRKRQQMLLLEGRMYTLQMDFNNRFLALREVKKKVIAEVNAKLARLREIREQLSALGAAPADADGLQLPEYCMYCMYPDEQPEMREVVNDEELEAYAARKEEEEKKAAAKETGGGGMGFGGGGAAPKDIPKKGGAAGTGPAAAKAKAAAAGGAPGTPEPSMMGGSTEDALSKMMVAGPQSELERHLALYQRNRMEFMQYRLRTEVDEMVEAFDGALSSLRREKFQLEADLKLGEIKMLVYYQELTLLRDFDKREIVLIGKRQTKLDDKQEIVDKITECNDKLEQKKRELQGLISRRAVVVADFDSCVPETDPFREQLTKIFLKKIKRSKKKAAKEDGDGDSEDEDEDDEDDGDEDGDEDDDGEEVCPSGCDQGLYERVCDLRERRLDEEDLITEFQKATEALKKEKETHAKKQRLVEQSLAAVQQDITEFQKEKQGRLNQIDVVVNLKMHQIEYLVDGRLPEDLSQGLVFSNSELQRLKRRIDELEQEKADLRARQKGLKKEHLQLLRDKRAKDEKVAEMDQKAYDVQMLKFGQVIDMDLLDRVGSTRGTEELKEELKRQEATYARELAECDRRIAARTDELMALTRENTGCLNAVSDLTVAQRQLEGALTATHNTMFSDPALNRRQEIEERDQLVQLVNAQAAEIDKLKAQIGSLRRKDTSVYG